MHTPADTNPAPPTMADLPYLPPTRRFVVLALFSTLLVFAFCMSVLIYRGVTVIEPRGVIFVNGNENWKGAKIQIEGGQLPYPLLANLESYNKFQVPFFLAPGAYRVSIDQGDFHAMTPFMIERDGVQKLLPLNQFDPTTQKSR